MELADRQDVLDVRVQVRERDGKHYVRGFRCTACGYRVAPERPTCPKCRGELQEDLVGPDGEVWASTVVRIPVGTRPPPYALAYVDFFDGPRVLCHVAGPSEAALAVGARVSVSGVTDRGDVVVAPADHPNYAGGH